MARKRKAQGKVDTPPHAGTWTDRKRKGKKGLRGPGLKGPKGGEKGRRARGSGPPNLLLFGNPNVGKSVIFSRLTGVEVMTSNYPGTTVGFTEGKTRVLGRRARLIDVPGIYSLDPTNKAEEVAVRMLDDGDVIVNIVDATHLERNLFLTLQLIETGKPVVVALSMWDETAHMGITIDVEALEGQLCVPVVPVVGLTGRGVKRMVERIGEVLRAGPLPGPGPSPPKTTEEEKWKRIGEISKEVQTLEHRHHKLRELIAEATIRPITGLPIAFGFLILMFVFIVTLGNLIIENILDPLFSDHFGPWIVGAVESVVPAGWARDLLVGQRIEGDIDMAQSFGLLTTGIYVPLVMVLPFVVLFYFILSLTEDIGYLPRLAVLMDGLMHRIGLHGSSVISVMLGLGCNVPGILATRILETRKQRFIQITLMAIGVPCLAMTAMIIGILGPHGIGYIVIVFISLVTVYILLGLVLKRVVKGESPELLLEMTPYRLPYWKAVLKKSGVRTKHFIKEAVPFVMLGVLIANILYISGAIEAMSWAFSPVTEWWLGLDGEATAALLMGFLRKDIAAGMLIPLGMTAAQLTVATTVLAMYFPCIATFTVIYKELGIRDLLKATLIMVGVSLLVGGVLRLLLISI